MTNTLLMPIMGRIECVTTISEAIQDAAKFQAIGE